MVSLNNFYVRISGGWHRLTTNGAWNSSPNRFVILKGYNDISLRSPRNYARSLVLSLPGAESDEAIYANMNRAIKLL